MTSLKSVLEHKKQDAVTESEALSLHRQRLQQLLDADGKETFKFGDERNALQKELESLLYELNAKNLLQEDKVINTMPRLADYLDLGVELIADDIGDITDTADDSEEDATEEESIVRQSA